MTETSSKTASSLAITEKRPQRSNSCVGVFFQLFDWNRRLAKKKLFSKNLFPQGIVNPDENFQCHFRFCFFVLFLSLINCFWMHKKIINVDAVFSEHGVGGAKRVSSKFGSDEKLPMAKLLVSSCLVEWLFHHLLIVYIAL